MLYIFITVILIIIMFFIILPPSFGRLPAGHILSGKTHLEIDGAKIGLILLSDDTDAPVLLVCGGGPGIPEYLMESLYPSVLPEFFTVCYFDYRGTGLSYDKNTDPKDRTEADIEDDNLKELQDTIMEKPENIYLIEEMAEDSQISPYHMIRKFKKAFGLTPHQFQMQCKVRKAQKLLETNESIPEVAYEAGFCDQSHMDRCFQKIVGMTPSQYQDAVKNG